MKGLARRKRAEQKAYYAKLAGGKNTASPEYWKSKKALPSKQERRNTFKEGNAPYSTGGFVSLGKISDCPECGFHGYGKQGQKRDGTLLKPKQKFCNNCGLNKPAYIMR